MDTSPGKIGLDILRSVCRPEWIRQPRADLSIFGMYKEVERAWDSGKRPLLHEYDKNKQYLGAAASAKLGVGVPEHVPSPAMEDRAGLWHVVIDAIPDGLAELPPVVRSNKAYIATPTVQLLHQFGYQFHAVEAWLFPEQHQVLRPFYERVKSLLERAETPEALVEVKRIYSVTFGLLAHSGEHQSASCLYRPDWWSALVAEARTRFLRQIKRVYDVEGIAPLLVDHDAVYYAQPVACLPLGAGIGQFKYKCLES
jgi:hypothetical protein